MSRVLAHIEKVKEIVPIAGADKIELAIILDWQCVVQKGIVKVGDLVVYHEIDSVVPDRPEYEFLRDKKFRIRTIRLRGELSQGLVLPLSILPKGIEVVEGLDVTEVLGIKHYDPEHTSNVRREGKKKTLSAKLFSFLKRYYIFRNYILPVIAPLIGKKGDVWPEEVPQTDEPNVQGEFSRIKRLYGDSSEFYATEKVDYQSATYFMRKKRGIFGTQNKYFVLSRTRNVTKETDSLWVKNGVKYNIEKILRSEKDSLIIQGESGGEKVQKNKYKISGSDLWIFNIIRVEKDGSHYHFNLNEMRGFCLKHGLNLVPVVQEGFSLPETVGELIESSRGFSKLNKDTIREGIVIRLIKDGKKLVSVKVKNPDFLIKHEE